MGRFQFVNLNLYFLYLQWRTETFYVYAYIQNVLKFHKYHNEVRLSWYFGNPVLMKFETDL